MAENNNAVENVLLGETVAEVVAKINAGIVQVNANATSVKKLEEAVEKLEDSVGDAGKVDDVQINGTSIVSEKIANIQFSAADGVVVTPGTTGAVTISAPTLASKISGVKVNGKELTPDENKKVNITVPDTYSKTEIDALLGNAAGAMKFKGTLGDSPSNSTVQTLPTNAQIGDTYKVFTPGYYITSLGYADRGDLYIYVGELEGTGNVDNTLGWVLVPSGDELDAVSAPNTFDTADTIIVANNAYRQVKSSGKTIVTEIGETTSGNVPTDTAVKNYVKSEIDKFSGGGTLANMVTASTDFTEKGRIVLTEEPTTTTKKGVAQSVFSIGKSLSSVNNGKEFEIPTSYAIERYLHKTMVLYTLTTGTNGHFAEVETNNIDGTITYKSNSTISSITLVNGWHSIVGIRRGTDRREIVADIYTDSEGYIYVKISSSLKDNIFDKHPDSVMIIQRHF